MVETRVAPEKTVSYANQYIADVKEALNDEPEKRREFFNILDYVETHRDDEAICVARMEELVKDHPNLLLGLNLFLTPEAESVVPLEAHQTIDPEAKDGRGKITTFAVRDERSITPPGAKKGLGQLQTMVGRRTAQEITKDEADQYVDAVKEAFRDERGKYVEFLKICNDIPAERFDRTSTIARMKELMKDHQELLLGLNILFPDDESKRTIPPEPSRSNPDEAKRTIPPEAKRTTTIILKARRTIPPEAKRTTIILKTKRTIPPDAEHHCAESNCTKRKHDGASFMDKLKTRFRSLDTHVVESFCEIMNEFREGTMSKKKVYKEVVNLLYYHEDLIEDFPRYLKRTKISTNSINISTRYLSNLTI